MTSPARREASIPLGLLAAVLLVGALVVGCGSDRSDDATVKRELAAELQLNPVQADCLWGYLTKELDRKVIAQIPRQGLTVIPAAHWGAYVEGALTCVLYPQLVPGGGRPRPGS